MGKLPWYSFLYRLFGAQGTFWLWLLAPLALWWTWEPAAIRLKNRKPRPVPIAAEGAPDVRWVRVQGLRLEVDRLLLLASEPPRLPPVVLLVDPSDPAAAWWRETLALCLIAQGKAEGRQGRTADGTPSPTEARRRLVRRFARLRGAPERFLPVPEHALLLQEHGAAPIGSSPQPVDGDPQAAVEAETQRQIERVLRRVREDTAVTGVLHPTPETLRRRLEDELPLRAPARLLRADQTPRELESIIFAVAAIVQIFLAAGLYGARRAADG
ncbi:MAG: hypothetical protein D6731_03485 [Planctomycetota bacterium]|nr:MAG: hypothetical protein D6731_03485 [Planctomycetota bacterium]